MDSIVQKLSEYKSSTPSRWREEAEFRTANKDWLRYSQHIAMMMLDKMEELILPKNLWPKKWNAANSMYQKY